MTLEVRRLGKNVMKPVLLVDEMFRINKHIEVFAGYSGKGVDF